MNEDIYNQVAEVFKTLSSSRALIPADQLEQPVIYIRLSRERNHDHYWMHKEFGDFRPLPKRLRAFKVAERIKVLP